MSAKNRQETDDTIVVVRSGMKSKDLPPDLRVALAPHEGSFEPLRFRGGRFYSVQWRQPDPLSWPEAVETEVRPGDALCLGDDGGVLHLRRGRVPVECKLDLLGLRVRQTIRRIAAGLAADLEDML